MQIETTHEIVSLNQVDARLLIHVNVDGLRLGAIVLASGPRVEIEAYVAGDISLDELSERILGKSTRRAV